MSWFALASNTVTATADPITECDIEDFSTHDIKKTQKFDLEGSVRTSDLW